MAAGDGTHYGTRMRVLAVLLPCLLGLPLARAQADDPLRIEFVRPAAWRCTTEIACTLCRNLGREPATVIVWRGTSAEHGLVPPDAVLRICPPEDRAA
jgi:hypothetical protein